MEKVTLFWMFVGIFGITAIITLLGITGVIKSIKDKYLNTLFSALIMEVIAAVFLMFKGFNFQEDKVDLQGLIAEAGLKAPIELEDQDDFIVDKLKSTIDLDQIKTENEKLKKELSELKRVKKEEGDSFYSNITQLDNIINNYKKNKKGNSINLAFLPEEKKEVYQILVAIFSHLGLLQEGDGTTNSNGSVNFKSLQKKYADFKARYNLQQDKYIFVDRADLSQLVREKLRLDD